MPLKPLNCTTEHFLLTHKKESMSVVIRELNIKVNVSEDCEEQNQKAAENDNHSRDTIINECVEKVVEMMKIREQR